MIAFEDQCVDNIREDIIEIEEYLYEHLIREIIPIELYLAARHMMPHVQGGFVTEG